jgi:predicted transcriptional regulator
MKLKEIIDSIEAEVIVGDKTLLDKNIEVICGSDLMSDVLSLYKPKALLLTGLTNSQVVRTAEMADILSVCFVRGKQPQEDTIALAKEKSISLLSTRYTMFESCGRLYQKGLRGVDDVG